MGLFVCDRCNAVENSTQGNYWSRFKNKRFFGEDYRDGEALCSECCPAQFSDGTPNKKGGKWHGIFDKKQWDGKKEMMNRKPKGASQ